MRTTMMVGHGTEDGQGKGFTASCQDSSLGNLHHLTVRWVREIMMKRRWWVRMELFQLPVPLPGRFLEAPQPPPQPSVHGQGGQEEAPVWFNRDVQPGGRWKPGQPGQENPSQVQSPSPPRCSTRTATRPPRRRSRRQLGLGFHRWRGHLAHLNTLEWEIQTLPWRNCSWSTPGCSFLCCFQDLGEKVVSTWLSVDGFRNLWLWISTNFNVGPQMAKTKIVLHNLNLIRFDGCWVCVHKMKCTGE